MLESFLDQTLRFLNTNSGKKEIGVQTDEDCKSLLKNLEREKNLAIQKLLKENNTYYFLTKDLKDTLKMREEELEKINDSYERLEYDLQELNKKYKKIKSSYNELYRSTHRKTMTRS
jgi:prefoldin subunit 5